ncbi:hypothetical protein H9Q13_16615 [Pontibacter sp. JH31]|uniref:Uncharacterized protein n=1 Tax=Pontibacter aquaedesilientis TaxID=2766980 RepID=A0ABR7XKH4_9BACT|nr:hypothetical protein [Pontibacter aquaedesilientis]MBD1398797.1 hypothetical protein [Pontibacter aquaedesilientis]
MDTAVAQGRQNPDRKKGARPAKRVRRSHTLSVRVTDTERLLIEGKAREAGMPLWT